MRARLAALVLILCQTAASAQMVLPVEPFTLTSPDYPVFGYPLFGQSVVNCDKTRPTPQTATEDADLTLPKSNAPTRRVQLDELPLSGKLGSPYSRFRTLKGNLGQHRRAHSGPAGSARPPVEPFGMRTSDPPDEI
jgi:hypothetical protein